MYSGVAIIEIISRAKLLPSTNIHREKLISTLSEVQRISAISRVFPALNFSLRLGSTEFR